MFIWLTLPQGASSKRLFDLAIQDRVAFVPGSPFYVDRLETDTLRLNFSCVDEDTIEIGMKRLGRAVEKLLNQGGGGQKKTADYISMSRPLICEPGLVKRWREGDRRPAECVSDNACFAPAMDGRGLYA